MRRAGGISVRSDGLFQFTHPGKGATEGQWYRPEDLFRFNSRTLGRVRLYAAPAPRLVVRVSIHAPWEGCDNAVSSSASMHPSFNSRTLGRVRRLTLRETIIWVKFQFTHPGKGATYLVRYLTTFPWFQFTHPGKGATSPRSPRSPWTPCFNSRTLGRVRRERLRYKHLPHRQFQFTHPGKGATWTLF